MSSQKCKQNLGTEPPRFIMKVTPCDGILSALVSFLCSCYNSCCLTMWAVRIHCTKTCLSKRFSSYVISRCIWHNFGCYLFCIFFKPNTLASNHPLLYQIRHVTSRRGHPTQNLCISPNSDFHIALVLYFYVLHTFSVFENRVTFHPNLSTKHTVGVYRHVIEIPQDTLLVQWSPAFLSSDLVCASCLTVC